MTQSGNFLIHPRIVRERELTSWCDISSAWYFQITEYVEEHTECDLTFPSYNTKWEVYTTVIRNVADLQGHIYAAVNSTDVDILLFM
jgi:hypothetical protein